MYGPCISTLLFVLVFAVVFFFKQKTAYEMRISDWSSDVCSSDLVWHCHVAVRAVHQTQAGRAARRSRHAVSRQGGALLDDPVRQIGSASCRERVCQYV